MTMKDDNARYGLVTRVLHWAMALLLLWQFLSAGAHLLLEDTAVEKFLWATHKPLGALLFLLAIIRGLWGLGNLSRRPASISVPARLGHLALYAFMIVVPGLALLRQYGSGRAFEAFGIPVFSGFEGERISWMINAGNLLHSSLGWVLLVMMAGHIFMVFWHRRTGSDVLPRMWR